MSIFVCISYRDPREAEPFDGRPHRAKARQPGGLENHPARAARHRRLRQLRHHQTIMRYAFICLIHRPGCVIPMSTANHLLVDYLLHPLPSYNRSPRVGAGAAILAIFYLLLFPLIATYIRLLYAVIGTPGFLPLGAERVQIDSAEDSEHSDEKQRRRRRRSSRKARDAEKVDPPADLEQGINNNAHGRAYDLDSVGLESFYTKDVFVCQDDGRPRYCSTCCQFKTDRSHHCRELDRCVRKMDHFCPWYACHSYCCCVDLQSLTCRRVGGVVSETSFKFFIQFVFYTTSFCTFALVVSAYFTAELKRNVSDLINALI